MRIRVLSDLHEEFVPKHGAALEFDQLDVDVTVLAGDIANGVGAVEVALRPCFANTTVLLVPGNHEYYGSVMSHAMQAMRERLSQARQQGQSNVILLDNQTHLVDDTLFIGSTMWTDYALTGDAQMAMIAAHPRMADYHLIHTAPDVLLTPQDTVALHAIGRGFVSNALKTQGPSKKWVVVSHHAPHAQSISTRFLNNSINAAFVSDLSALMGQPQLWIHGHTHDGFDYTVNGTRVVSNPAGYRKRIPSSNAPVRWHFENGHFDPNKIIQI
jgi:predicted phosphodiesterase